MATSQSISTLLQHISLDDHEEILKASNTALKKSKTNLAAQHARLIALIKLDRCDDAQRVLDESGDALRANAPLEWAYTLYKTGNPQHALEVAATARSKTDSSSAQLLHMQAQAAYRSEHFVQAAELYDRLASEHGAFQDESEELDLRINRTAVDALLHWSKQGALARKIKPDREDLEHFETVYNAACGYVARGELKQAELLLSRATDLCNATDELSADQKQLELLPITTQKAFVLSKMGRHDEARQLCATLEFSDPSDSGTQYVANTIEMSTTNRLSNPYLAQRRLHSSSLQTSNDNLFSFQKTVLGRNALILDLQTKRLARVKNAVSTEAEARSASENAWLGFLRAAAQCEMNPQAAIEDLSPLLKKEPKDVGLILTLVQLHVLTGRTADAIVLLGSFLEDGEAVAAPSESESNTLSGLIGCLISLYAHENRLGQAKATVAKVLSHKTQREAVASSNLPGAILMESPCSIAEADTAHATFKSALEQNSSNAAAMAGYVASSNQESQDVSSLEARLPRIEELISEVETDRVEEAGVARLERRLPTKASATKRSADGDNKAQKAKKIRRTKMPKDFDPGKKLDSERWLPLRERSNWRPKGKKKGRAAHGGMATQGGMVQEDSRPTTPSQQQKQGGGGASKQKKKKAKGGK